MMYKRKESIPKREKIRTSKGTKKKKIAPIA